MDFIELQVSCKPEFREILVAETWALGFQSMLETTRGFNAYIGKEKFNEEILSGLIERYGSKARLRLQTQTVKQKNWNEEWEKNFDPVIINGRCGIRASFHPPFVDTQYEIIIDPKMSFGTGHHETTSIMIRMQMQLDHEKKKVLDCGCGTGVLSILADKMNASDVVGLDIDKGAVENSKTNAKLNHIKNATFYLGDINSKKIGSDFDIILANINKNVLLGELKGYSKKLTNKGGRLLLSGFYTSDLDEILQEANQHFFLVEKTELQNDWAGIQFILDT